MVLDPARRTSGKIELQLVNEAPSPVFAAFERAHDGMFGFMKMFGGVFVLRRIAAAHVSAVHAEAKMNPLVARLEALFTTVGVRLDILLNLSLMRAFIHN